MGCCLAPPSFYEIAADLSLTHLVVFTSSWSTHHKSDWDVACMTLNHLTLLHIYTSPSTQHHLHNIVNTTPSTLHHQHNIINTTSSTHHHLHNTIYTTPSTQHHPHSTTCTTSSHIGRCSTWSTAILPLLPHSCWYPSCYSLLWFVLCSVSLTYSTLGCPKTLLTCGVIRSYNFDRIFLDYLSISYLDHIRRIFADNWQLHRLRYPSNAFNALQTHVTTWGQHLSSIPGRFDSNGLAVDGNLVYYCITKYN